MERIFHFKDCYLNVTPQPVRAFISDFEIVELVSFFSKQETKLCELNIS